MVDPTSPADGSGPFVVLSLRVDRCEANDAAITADLRKLVERVGEPPNVLTGHRGSGLYGAVADHLDQERRGTIGATALGAGGGGAIVVALVELAHRLGLF